MKHGKVFWGTLFIALGILGLMASLGIYLHISFDTDWVIPLLLVLLGLTFILKHNSAKVIIVVLAGLISGMTLFSIFWDEDEHDSFFKTQIVIDEDEEELTADDGEEATSSIVPYYDLDYMELKLLAAASEMHISGTTTTAFTAEVKGKKFDMDFQQTDGRGKLKISHQKGKTSGLRNLDLVLNDSPEYQISVKSGASELEMNLSDLKVKKLKADLAATDAKIKLGDKQTVLNAELTFAASELTIYVPKTVGCMLNGDFSIVSKNLDGFIEEGENTYVTKNFSDAKKKILIDLKGALADFEIKFY